MKSDDLFKQLFPEEEVPFLWDDHMRQEMGRIGALFIELQTVDDGKEAFDKVYIVETKLRQLQSYMDAVNKAELYRRRFEKENE